MLITVIALALWVPYEFSGGELPTSSQESELSSRLSDLVRLKDLLERYRKLSARAEQIEKTYARAQFSTEEVFAEVEKIIRGAIGGDGYELRPSQSPVSVSSTVEQQLFTLRLKSVTLEQMVKILFELEQGKAPLFLGKLEVTKAVQKGSFVVAVELSSLRRKRNG